MHNGILIYSIDKDMEDDMAKPKKKHNFKVGDIVEVISDEASYYRPGTILKIREFRKGFLHEIVHFEGQVEALLLHEIKPLREWKSVKKIRPFGEILLDMEPLIQEMFADHDIQHGDFLGVMMKYLDIHLPDYKEQYVDGTEPIHFYGHIEDFLKLAKEKKK